MISVSLFIENFKKGFNAEYLEDVFTNGNCYHFALILEKMFEGEIIYDPHESHFLTKVEDKYYDIRGEVDKPIDEYLWEDMEEIDFHEYNLIKYNCLYKI